MFAYLLLLFAALSRVTPHADWLNFTAVGGSLLYFGARRPLREAALPVAVLAATDYYLTVFGYGYSFHLGAYLTTWLWYVGIVLMGAGMLKANASWKRVGGATVLSATSFFLISNFAVWAGSVMYPHSVGGLTACYAAALPFYRNDLVSTTLVAAVAFGGSQLVSRWAHEPEANRAAAS